MRARTAIITKNSKREPRAHAATAAVPNPAISLVASIDDSGGRSWLTMAGPMMLSKERTLCNRFRVCQLNVTHCRVTNLGAIIMIPMIKEIIVAIAAPLIPISRVKIKIGSKTKFVRLVVTMILPGSSVLPFAREML